MSSPDESRVIELVRRMFDSELLPSWIRKSSLLVNKLRQSSSDGDVLVTLNGESQWSSPADAGLATLDGVALLIEDANDQQNADIAALYRNRDDEDARFPSRDQVAFEVESALEVFDGDVQALYPTMERVNAERASRDQQSNEIEDAVDSLRDDTAALYRNRSEEDSRFGTRDQVAEDIEVAVAEAKDELSSALYYTLQGSCIAGSPADSTAYYFGSLSSTGWGTSDGVRKIVFPSPGTVVAASVRAYATTAAGSNESWTWSFRLNATTNTSLGSVAAATAERRWEAYGLSVRVNAGDYFEMTTTTPAWVTNPTGVVLECVVLVRCSA